MRSFGYGLDRKPRIFKSRGHAARYAPNRARLGAFSGQALRGASIGGALAANAPVKSVIGALVMRRAGVKLADVYQGEFSDAQFAALTDNVMAVKTSILLVKSPVDQLGLDASANQ